METKGWSLLDSLVFFPPRSGLRLAYSWLMHIDNRDQQPSLWRQASRRRTFRTLSADEIAARAYAKYQGRDTADDRAVNDWLDAERELLQEKILPRG